MLTIVTILFALFAIGLVYFFLCLYFFIPPLDTLNRGLRWLGGILAFFLIFVFSYGLFLDQGDEYGPAARIALRTIANTILCFLLSGVYYGYKWIAARL